MPKRTRHEISADGTTSQSSQGRSYLQRGTSRRAFLSTAAVASVTSLGGCIGGTASDGDDDGPEPPWTTEELADHIDDDAELTIYAASGDEEQWHDGIEVINDEFGTNISADVFASNGAEVSQRFLQERRAGDDQADVLGSATNLRDRIKNQGKEEGEKKAKEWFEWDIDSNFWFNDVLPDDKQMPFQVAGFNGGAGSCMPVSEEIFEDQGLDYPETYSDLLDDQYEGLDVAQPGYVSSSQVGWIIRYHADQMDMDYMEWAEAFTDHFNLVGVSSHSDGTREVGRGNMALMIYNWPWSAAPFVKNDDLAVTGHFTDPVLGNEIESPLSINKEASNPWVARYFVSAYLEEPVQRRLVNDVTDQIPVRTDLDYSSENPGSFMQNRLNANTFDIGFYEGAKYNTTGQNAIDNGYFEP